MRCHQSLEVVLVAKKIFGELSNLTELNQRRVVSCPDPTLSRGGEWGEVQWLDYRSGSRMLTLEGSEIKFADFFA